ncbi:MAG: TlpA family protein disulfide reductase [Candidatus Eremiobacteraeota bacterium]|nr:TlpA family protein disulfide reductase [Candidatus Eremiobacteraeota bacterium]MBV9055555.1 TlpA family protein disulfide reductase [Candidatus Eremiobacteraeota bacterium]MBV9700215.1 TlpA family protein disulfide reductase [Candidatus Eremiobacteraeota bacterium]
MNRRAVGLVTIVAVAVIVVAAAAMYFWGPRNRALQNASQSPVIGKAQVGRPAPNFEVATTAGLFTLSAARKPVFLEVFATWCPHCQRETAVINRLYRRYGSAVNFVGVSGSDTGMDGSSPASENDVLNWVRRFNAAYPVAYDPLMAVANLYLQGGFPTYAIIGRDKRVAYLNSGELSYGDLAAALRRVL